MTAEETDVVEWFTAQGGTIVAEFNTMALPTGEGVRQRWERLLHLRWSGWVGRFIEDLGNMDDIPNWIPYLWEMQTGQRWRFHGPGIVFADTNERIVVLEADRHLGPDFVRIQVLDAGNALLDGATDRVPFYYWFAVVVPDPDTKVHAEYVLDVTPEGEATLRAFGIASHFPAVLSHQGLYRAYYFAGDFADNAVVPGPYQVAFYPAYRRQLPRYREYRSNEWFFWEFYVPLVRNVLDREEALRAR